MKKQYMYNDETMKWEKDGHRYLAHIQDDEFRDSPRQWDNVTTMACWHSRYDLGDSISENDPSEFWQNLVRTHVPELEVATAVEAGKLPGIRLVQDPENSSLVDIYEVSQSVSIFGRSDPEENLEYEGVSREAILQCIADDLTVKHCMILMEPYAEWLPLWLYDHSGITMSCGARVGQFADAWDSSQVGWIIALKDTIIKELCATEENWREKAEENMRADVKIYDQYLTGEVYGYTLYEQKDAEWDEIESSWGFYGSEINESGLVENLPGAAEALERDQCEFGQAQKRTVTTYIFD